MSGPTIAEIARIIDPEIDSHREGSQFAKCRALVSGAEEKASEIIDLFDQQQAELVEALRVTLTAWAAAKAGDIGAANFMNAAEEQAKAALAKARGDAR